MGFSLSMVKKTTSFVTQDGTRVDFKLSSVYRICVNEDEMTLFWDYDFDGEGDSDTYHVSKDQIQDVLNAWTEYMESDKDE